MSSCRSRHDRRGRRCELSRVTTWTSTSCETPILTLPWDRTTRPGLLLCCVVVIDTRVRPRVTRFLEPIGKALASVGVTPTAMTAIGLATVILGSIVISTGACALVRSSCWSARSSMASTARWPEPRGWSPAWRVSRLRVRPHG